MKTFLILASASSALLASTSSFAACPTSFGSSTLKEVRAAYLCKNVIESDRHAQVEARDVEVCVTVGPVKAEAVSTYGRKNIVVVDGVVNPGTDDLSLTRIYWGSSGLPISKYRTRTQVGKNHIKVRDGKSPDIWDNRGRFESLEIDRRAQTLHYHRWFSEGGVALDVTLKCEQVK